MKILLITDGIAPFVVGGMQKHSANLVRELVQLGHQVTLLHCVPHGATLPNRASVIESMALDPNSTLKTICIAFPKAGLFPGHYLKESYVYSKYCFDAVKADLNSFDFIYAKGFTAWYFLFQKSKGTQIPPIGVKFHGYEMFQKPLNWRMRMQHWLLKSPVIWNNRQADFVFSYGGKITSLIEGIGVASSRIISIPTGIDPSWIVKTFKASTSEKRTILFVGRYERRKGIEELHAVIPGLLQNPKVHFELIGPIPHSKRLKHDRVTYHGQLTNAAEIKAVMDQCQILVTPSHSEGMPNVIMEGMSRGLAVVATDVGAVAAVVDASNGVLISHINQQALDKALNQIIHVSDAELDDLRRRSLSKVNEFVWSKIGQVVAKEIGERVGAQ
jgi:glycosyltransferase involved in cell wall biosynthesis